MPIVIDLFSGMGGLSLGAARAGFRVCATVELDKHANLTHSLNFPKVTHIQADIMSLSGSDILNRANLKQNDIDGVIGGPPCQGFSSIGRGDVEDSRNQLFIQFFRLVSQLQPAFFLAENVPGIMNKKYDSIRQAAFQNLDDYTLLPPISVNASEYGAPTTRTRYFFIGYRKTSSKLKGLSIADIEQAKVAEFEKTNVEQALEGLPDDIRCVKSQNSVKQIKPSYYSSTTRLQSEFYYERITAMIPDSLGNEEYIKLYKSKHQVNGCTPTKHSNDVRKRFAHLSYNEQDTVSKCKRLDPKGYCPTLRSGTGPEKGSFQAVRPVHYRYNRVITPREAARLQGFPDWFKLPDTIWHSFRQIGNSVSPIVAERILSVIFRRLHSENLDNDDNTIHNY